MFSLQDAIDAFNDLSPQERDLFLTAVFSGVRTARNSPPSQLDGPRFADGLKCPNCASVRVVKNGKGRGYVQRYLCRGCGRTFSFRTGTFLSHSRKDIAKWRLYVKTMELRLSLRKAAKACQITLKTAFQWRHKILDALRERHEAKTRISGIVEADETFFRLSFKGMRHLEEIIGRKPRKRGGAVAFRGLSKEQVCVPCGIGRDDGRALFSAACLGRPSWKSIENAFGGGKIAESSVFCTDKANGYGKFASNNGIKHIQLKGGKCRTGIYHIQHVNAYHSGLKAFLAPFLGVSTKYLPNYLAWNDINRIASRDEMDWVPFVECEAIKGRVDYSAHKLWERPRHP